MIFAITSGVLLHNTEVVVAVVIDDLTGLRFFNEKLIYQNKIIHNNVDMNPKNTSTCKRFQPFENMLRIDIVDIVKGSK